MTKPLRKYIYKHHNVLCGPNNAFCTACTNAAIDNIDTIKFDTTKIEYDSFDCLDTLLDELDVNMNLLSCRNANKMDETVKPTRSPLLDINNMSNDIEIALCCGFRMNKLRQILNKVNVELPESISALKLSQLFIAFVVWRHNISSRFAKILFGYQNQSSICYNINKIMEFCGIKGAKILFY